jgi:hypothetical protein
LDWWGFSYTAYAYAYAYTASERYQEMDAIYEVFCR